MRCAAYRLARFAVVLTAMICALAGSTSCRSKSSIDYVNAGLRLAKQDLHAAIKQYDKAIEINPGLDLAFALRGGAWEELGDYSAALKDLDRAVDLAGSGEAVARTNRARVWRARGDYTRAMADHTRAIQLDPEFAAAFGQRAATLMLMEQPAEAARDYKRAIELDPEYDLAHIALASIYAYSRVRELRDPESAIDHATKGCELTGYRLPQYLVVLSDSYRAAGMEEHAKKYSALAQQLARQYLNQK